MQIGVDANRVSEEVWRRLYENFSEPQIVEAACVITQYIAISKFRDALGVELEPVFDGMQPSCPSSTRHDRGVGSGSAADWMANNYGSPLVVKRGPSLPA